MEGLEKGLGSKSDGKLQQKAKSAQAIILLLEKKFPSLEIILSYLLPFKKKRNKYKATQEIIHP